MKIIVTIDNVKDLQESLGRSVVQRSLVIADKSNQSWWKRVMPFIFEIPQYVLLDDLAIQLRNGMIITIEKGFTWDLSSVPRLMWGILPPDGNFELASLIHDYLYKTKLMSQKKADEEMFAWSKAVAGTEGRRSWSDVDNWVRYAGVRLFGWKGYNKKKYKL